MLNTYFYAQVECAVRVKYLLHFGERGTDFGAVGRPRYGARERPSPCSPLVEPRRGDDKLGTRPISLDAFGDHQAGQGSKWLRIVGCHRSMTHTAACSCAATKQLIDARDKFF